MAEKLGLSKELIRESYYLPLQETHPKVQSIAKRKKYNKNGEVEYKHDQESYSSNYSLYCSHLLLILSFEAFMKYFDVKNATDTAQTLVKNFEEVWAEIDKDE